MTAPQQHRASLLLALAGVTLMLAVALTNLQAQGGPTLPNRESSSSGQDEFWLPRA